VPAGLVLANLVYSAVSSGRSPDDFLASGAWRIPFLLSAVLVAVGIFIRLQVSEPPGFARVKETRTEARMPIVEALRKHPKGVAVAFGARFAENGFFYIYTTFVLAYVVQTLKLPASVGLNGVLIAGVLELGTMLAYGALTDRVGRRPVYLFGAIFSLLFAFPFFWMVETRDAFLVGLAIVVGLNLGHAAMYATQASFFSELFGTRVRYSGASLGYQLSSVFAGGLSPIIATAMLASFGTYVPVAVYLVFMAAVTIVAVWAANETRRQDIHEEDPAGGVSAESRLSTVPTR
jgi:MFS transporter, MHS family, shikimate and dehydroshikimate transport protein